jgi:hypothetical protein
MNLPLKIGTVATPAYPKGRLALFFKSKDKNFRAWRPINKLIKPASEQENYISLL